MSVKCYANPKIERGFVFFCFTLYALPLQKKYNLVEKTIHSELLRHDL